MSDFFEKDTPVAEENSTIFSDPVEHREIKKKKKKLWLVILSAFLSVAILVSGTVAVIRLIPVLQEETSAIGEETVLVEVESDNVKDVTVKNKVGTTKFYSVKTEDDGIESIDWYIKNIDKDVVNSVTISNLVDAVAKVTAFREITEKTSADCGLENPKVKATVNMREGESYVVSVGEISPDNSGYYVNVSNSEKIYLATTDIMDTLDFNLLDFADNSIVPSVENNGDNDDYFADGQIAKFDKITLKGNKFPEPLVLVQNEDEEMAQYMGYMVESPTKRIAQNVESVLLIFQSGIEIDGAYSFDNSAKSLEKFGLNNPDLEMRIDFGTQSFTYKFALQEDGNFAVTYDGCKLIKIVTYDSISTVYEMGTTDYYFNWICYYAIDDISNFTVNCESGTYSFDIKKNETEEDSEEDASVQTDEEEEAYTITHNGKKLVAMNFQNLYKYCITLKCTDFEIKDINADPDVSFTFKFKTGKESVIEFFKVSATKYQYTLDGINMGRVSVNSIKKVIENTEKVANGETVGELM